MFDFSVHIYIYESIHLISLQCNAMKYNAMQWNTMKWNEIQRNEMQWNTAKCNEMQWNAMQYILNAKFCSKKPNRLIMCSIKFMTKQTVCHWKTPMNQRWKGFDLSIKINTNESLYLDALFEMKMKRPVNSWIVSLECLLMMWLFWCYLMMLLLTNLEIEGLKLKRKLIIKRFISL